LTSADDEHLTTITEWWASLNASKSYQSTYDHSSVNE